MGADEIDEVYPRVPESMRCTRCNTWGKRATYTAQLRVLPTSAICRTVFADRPLDSSETSGRLRLRCYSCGQIVPTTLYPRTRWRFQKHLVIATGSRILQIRALRNRQAKPLDIYQYPSQ